MEAIVLSFCMVAFAGVLTRKESNSKAYERLQSQTENQSKSKNSSSEKEKPYYEKFIFKNGTNDYVDFSGGLMGI